MRSCSAIQLGALHQAGITSPGAPCVSRTCWPSTLTQETNEIAIFIENVVIYGT